MPAVHCPSDHIGRSSVAGLHDADRVEKYVTCIQEAIGYMRQTLSRPRVLHIGFGLGGLLPSVSFLMGAAVTVVDANNSACEIMRARVLEHNLTGVRIVNVNSTRFHDEEPYDLVIMDSFGSTLAEKGQFVYAYDLVRRGMVRKFEDECRFIPAEVSMGLSLYTCPSLSILQQKAVSHQNLSFWLGLAPPTSTDRKLKFVPAAKLLPFSLDATTCDRAADRREVAYARYGSRKEPLVTVSHVDVDAGHARHGPRLWLLEWVATLTPFEHLPQRHVGTYLGLEAGLDPACRLARHVAWGHLCCLEPAVCATYCIKIGVRANGELTLIAQDEPAAEVKQVSFLKRIDAVAEGTFAASLPSSAAKK